METVGLDALSKVVGLLVIFVGVVAWFIRLESESKSNKIQIDTLRMDNIDMRNKIDVQKAEFKEEINELRKEYSHKFSEVQTMFIGIKEQLAKIEGYLQATKDN